MKNQADSAENVHPSIRICRACMQEITPVSRTLTVASHQSGDVRQFSLYKMILCCPKCGERDL